jgi:hypothetical protein
MKIYAKPEIDILGMLPQSLLEESEGNDPNRDNYDEEGGTMTNTSFFDDIESSGKGNLWDE